MTEGVYLNLPEPEYRADEAISQSQLKEFGEYATPLHYLARKPKAATADMEFGTLCHAAVLTPETFSHSYHLRPQKYPAEVKGQVVNKDWHGGSVWCQKWLAEHSDRPVVTSEQLANIHRIAEGLMLTNTKLSEFQSALAYGQTEVSFFKRDDVTGLMLKCRVDVMATDGEGNTWLWDLKKVQSGEANPKAFSRQAFELGYDIQAAFYLHVTGASRFVFVPFDDSEPYDACQFEPDYDMIKTGELRWRSLLNHYAECVKSGNWPGYAEGIHSLALPVWAAKQTTL